MDDSTGRNRGIAQAHAVPPHLVGITRPKCDCGQTYSLGVVNGRAGWRPSCVCHLVDSGHLDASHRGQPKVHTMTDPVRGHPAASGTYEHPRWSDGTPILIDDEVEHATEGWGGFVGGVPNSEEIAVCWYMHGGDISDAIEHRPDELIRVTATDQPLPDGEDHVG